MLSAAVETTKALTRKGISPTTSEHRSIWFDILGQAFVLLQTHTFFALSITLLVVGPLVLLITLVILQQSDKLYLWANSKSVHTTEGDTPVKLYGWRGLFRFPIIVVFSSAAPVALAYLLFKENEEIIHSSPWPVWAMMISAFLFVGWFLARFFDAIRPSALTRAYGFGWICFGWWAFLVLALIYEEQFHLSGGYFALFFSASAFLATWLSYLELFSLPKKKAYAREKLQSEGYTDESRQTSRPGSSRRVEEEAANDDEEEDPTEQSSLLRSGGRSAYKTVPHEEEDNTEQGLHSLKPSVLLKHDEQEWSAKQWDWFWLLQFIVLIPINIILLGQLGFYLTEALHQTGQDGSSVFLVYLGIAIITIFMFSPVLPMIHRFSWPIPTFLLLVLIGTIIYNLLAFPFSPQNQLKLYFQQQIDLENGNNTVSLLGLPPFVEDAVAHIPSAAGQHVKCVKADTRRKCSWTGPTPQVAGSNGYTYSRSPYKGLLHYNASIVDSTKSSKTARFAIGGQNTRACKLIFDLPITVVHIKGQAPEDKRLPSVPEHGSQELRLWSRTWNRTWTVDVSWDAKEHGSSLSGRAVCEWSDVNQKGVIPAFDEVKHYVPTWVAITKAGDGLVEGYKSFNITS